MAVAYLNHTFLALGSPDTTVSTLSDSHEQFNFNNLHPPGGCIIYLLIVTLSA